MVVRQTSGNRISPVLVGRATELATLTAAVAAPPSVVVVAGEAGIGKSRLVREVLAAVQGRVSLVGHCDPVQEPFPLGPVLEAIREGAAHLPPPAELNPVAGALAPLLPEIAGRLPPAPPALGDQQAERHRVFRAVAAVLADLGAAVLVIEDVHWADAGTSQFLAFLGSRLPPRLTLMLTVRTESDTQLPLWEALSRGRSGPPVRITVPPLRSGEVRVLAETILGAADLSEAAVTALCERTGGIPFLVEELLDGRVATPGRAGRNAAIAEAGVPAALRDLVLHRLSSLGEESREILGAAAVLGMAPDEPTLAAMTGHDASTVARALSRGLAVGLLHDQRDRSGFRHALARQAVYEAVPAPTRRWLHRRAALSLQDNGRTRPVARLAYHYRLAGMTAEFVQHAEEAADLALSHGDDATAARFLLQTMDVADLPLQTRVRLAVKLGRSAADGLAQSEAAPLIERLLADGGLPTGPRGELRFMLGRLLRQQGEAARGYGEIERSVPDLADRPALLGRALAILAVPDVVADRHVREHAERSGQALRAAERSGDPRVVTAVRIANASMLLGTGDPAGWPLVDRLRQDPSLLAQPREHARACLNWAQGALETGDLPRAESLLADARRLVERAEYVRLAGIVELVTASVDLAAGRWDGLLDRTALLAGQPTDFPAAGLDARALYGCALAVLGDPDEAEQLLRDVVEAGERLGVILPTVPARAALAHLRLRAGDFASAAQHARAAIAVVRRKGNWVWGARSVLHLVDALAGLGDPRSAQPQVEELAAGLAGRHAPAAQAALSQARAELLAAAGDHAGATELAEAAADRLAALRLRYAAARASERAGRLSAPATGGRQLEFALREFGALGAAGDAARLVRTMRRLGVPVPYPWRGGRRAYGGVLSPREREVAGLAAAGQTNQQIAARLYLSRRTVESHIANVLRKLGGSSRRDLPALMRRLD